jgi:filamentous hemagglutinin
MPNVTVYGVSQSVVTIPINSTAAASLAQVALNMISAAIVNNTVTPFNWTGTIPPSSTPAELVFQGATNSATIPGGGQPVVSMVSNQTGLLSITNAAANASTVVSGAGGLTYTQTAASVAGSLIVSGGGQSNIDLATGANTVSVDVTPTSMIGGGIAIGSATINALAGGASIYVNPSINTSTILDDVLIAAAGGDSINIAGSAAVLLEDTTNAVTVGSGGAGFFANGSSLQGATNILTAPGNEVVGVLTGSTESITGSLTISGGSNIYVAGGSALQGSMFINATGQNVTVFPDAGNVTLFGAGDAMGVTNTGTDFVLDGTGYFHAGSGGGSLLESAVSISGAATTLVGGGANDVLFAQSTNVSLKGSAGTAILDAAGETISGGVDSIGGVTVSAPSGLNFTVDGANGGVSLNAGASNALMFGADSGANTIISGTGSSTVFGHSGATSGSGDLYLDGGVGSMTILDFGAADLFKLTGSQTVSSVNSSVVTLSDGTRITISDGFITGSNVNTYFHG